MEFKKSTTPRFSKRKLRGHIKVDNADAYDHSLQLYRLPPTDTISLEEFEELAVERLKVLKAVETAGVRNAKGSENYAKYLEKEIRETKLKHSIFEKSVMDDSVKQRNRWKDHVSHFILRLAYCRSEDLRRWFIQQEVDLFRFRFQQESAESRADFMACSNLSYQPIEQEEHDHLRKKLDSASGKDDTYSKGIQHYKVHFTEALDLVRARRVYIHGGFAYVPQDDLVSILLTVYRVHLSHSLALTARALPHLEEDGRLLPMLGTLSRRYIGQDYSAKKPVGQITADMIDMLSKKSFPLCMQQLHTAMRGNHHLRYWGRRQYGLFLKGIGLSLDEAVKFWRTEFTKIIDGDKFDKQYLYNIRHDFGKEGKKADYTPYGCMKIITTNPPSAGDFHEVFTNAKMIMFMPDEGCPYKHCDTDILKSKLTAQGLRKDEADQVLHYSKGGHYQVACAKMFELLHGSLTGDEEAEVSFQHPNQYFEESYKRLHKGAADKASSTPKTPRGVGIVRAASSQGTPKSSESQPVSLGTPKSSASQPVSQDTPPSSATQLSTSQLSGIEAMEDDFDDDTALQEMDDSQLQGIQA